MKKTNLKINKIKIKEISVLKSKVIKLYICYRLKVKSFLFFLKKCILLFRKDAFNLSKEIVKQLEC